MYGCDTSIGYGGKTQLPPPQTPPKKKKSCVHNQDPITKQPNSHKAPILAPLKNSPALLHHKGNISRTSSAMTEKSLSLTDFVKQYSHSLPLRVRIKEGFCGNDERWVLIHFFLVPTPDPMQLCIYSSVIVRVAHACMHGGIL